MKGSDGKVNYSTLINRKVAVASCVIGVLEVLIGITLLICGFILLGGFCENLECGGFTTGSGLYIGFPLLIPGFLGLVVMGTRHLQALHAYMLTNLIVCIFSIVHVIMSHRDYTDYWSGQKDLYDQGKCQLASARKCECEGGSIMGFRCDLIQFGYDTNWFVFGLAIASVALTLFGFVTGLIGRAIRVVSGRSKY